MLNSDRGPAAPQLSAQADEEPADGTLSDFPDGSSGVSDDAQARDDEPDAAPSVSDSDVDPGEDTSGTDDPFKMDSKSALNARRLRARNADLKRKQRSARNKRHYNKKKLLKKLMWVVLLTLLDRILICYIRHGIPIITPRGKDGKRKAVSKKPQPWSPANYV